MLPRDDSLDGGQAGVERIRLSHSAGRIGGMRDPVAHGRQECAPLAARQGPSQLRGETRQAAVVSRSRFDGPRCLVPDVNTR